MSPTQEENIFNIPKPTTPQDLNIVIQEADAFAAALNNNAVQGILVVNKNFNNLPIQNVNQPAEINLIGVNVNQQGGNANVILNQQEENFVFGGVPLVVNVDKAMVQGGDVQVLGNAEGGLNNEENGNQE